MKEVHMVMKYVCDKCGFTAHMYLEKGLEEECNAELRVKSGMPHKPVPFLIDCPECGQGLMHDKGWKGFSEFIPVRNGMNIFVNDPNKGHGIPVFNYHSWDTSPLREFVNEVFEKRFRECEDTYIQRSDPLVEITEKDTKNPLMAAEMIEKAHKKEEKEKKMEEIKKTSDLQFELHYADGTVSKVHKGILFEETEEGGMNVHIATDNQFNMFIAILEASADLISRMTNGKIRVRVIAKEK